MNFTNTIYAVSKDKTNIRGYWKDGSGKLYKDNIKLIDYNKESVKNLFSKGELAVLYTDNSQANIESIDGSISILRTCLCFHVKKLSVKLYKKILENHNGFTVFKNKTFNDYTIEIWS